jgi:hypothetical protein
MTKKGKEKRKEFAAKHHGRPAQSRHGTARRMASAAANLTRRTLFFITKATAIRKRLVNSTLVSTRHVLTPNLIKLS